MFSVRKGNLLSSRWMLKPFMKFPPVRTHMSHQHPPSASSPTGPRQPVALGLDCAKSTSNLLRLLESSHSGFAVTDTLSTVWHPKGLLFRHEAGAWVASNPLMKESSAPSSATRPPNLVSMSLSDDRTALMHLVGVDGKHIILSLLRLDADFAPHHHHNHHHGGMVANDGWTLVRELVSGDNNISDFSREDAYRSLIQVLDSYLSIEHGGGMADRQKAESLFASNVSLLSVGTSKIDEPASDWSAPVGSLLEISRQVYLDGVQGQSPHETASRDFDSIETLTLLPCGLAAVATVHVGNGARTMVFCDHLFLGRRTGQDDRWQILSKVFSPRPWPR